MAGAVGSVEPQRGSRLERADEREPGAGVTGVPAHSLPRDRRAGAASFRWRASLAEVDLGRSLSTTRSGCIR